MRNTSATLSKGSERPETPSARKGAGQTFGENTTKHYQYHSFHFKMLETL